MTRLTIRFVIVMLLACVASFTIVAIAGNVHERYYLKSYAVKEFLNLGAQLNERLKTDGSDSPGSSLASFSDNSGVSARMLSEGEVRDWLSANSPGNNPELLVRTNQPGRAVAMSVSREQVARVSQAGDQLLFVALLGIASVFIVAAIVLSYPLVRKLHQQETAVMRITEGDFTARVRVEGRDAFGKLSQRINHMADRIHALVQSHRQLMQTVSHEMRTPLSRLHFALESLEPTGEHGEGERDTRQLDAMRRDLTELDDLLDELLTFSKLDAGVAPIDSIAVPVRPTLEDILRRGSTSQPHVAGRLECDSGEVCFLGDARLLTRAVGNVVRNAFRFAKSKVIVLAKAEADQIVVQVDDDGPGIEQGDRERVFTPFVQLKDSRDGGTGLGLSIARRIIEQHQGTIAFDDAPIGGARCIIRLPADKGSL
jgi:signal transduction histidine kinase